MRRDKTGASGETRRTVSRPADASTGDGFLGGGRYDGFLIALLALAVYLRTMSRAVAPYDFGELVASAATLGIMHPTGYPLLTLLGRVVSMLPVPGADPILKLNLLSTLFCVAAVYFFHRLVLMLLRGWPASPAGNPDSATRIAAAGATLGLAFSRIFWIQATSFEVYAFHLLFTTMVLVLFLESLRPGASMRTWMVFAFTLGLSFTNHMMMVLLAPACLYLHFSIFGSGRESWRRVLVAIPPFLAGLTPYLYLPIRAAADPLMNWTRPTTLEAFWRHVSARQYQHKMLASLQGEWDKVRDFFKTLPLDFAGVPVLIAVLGAAYLLKRDRKMGAFALLLFLACVFFVGFYEMIDSNFELNAHVAVAVFLGFGILALARRAGSAKPWLGPLFLVPCLLPLALNFEKVDLSKDYVVEDYARNVLESVDKNAVILSGQGATFVFPAYYLQIVSGLRRDVAVIDTSVLAVYWHVADLEKLHPDLFSGSRSEMHGLLEEGRRALLGKDFNVAIVETRRDDVIRSLVLRSGRPVYVTYDVTNARGFRKLPNGLTYRLVDRSAPPPEVSFHDFHFRPMPESSPPKAMIRRDYVAAYVNQGIQAAVVYGDTALGLGFMRKAMAVDPTFEPARNWMTRLSPR